MSTGAAFSCLGSHIFEIHEYSFLIMSRKHYLEPDILAL